MISEQNQKENNQVLTKIYENGVESWTMFMDPQPIIERMKEEKYNQTSKDREIDEFQPKASATITSGEYEEKITKAQMDKLKNKERSSKCKMLRNKFKREIVQMDKDVQRAQHNRENGIKAEITRHNKINMWFTMLERSKRIWETTTRRMKSTTDP